jgi:guanylate kinase
MKKGLLVVLSGPSGTGKTTICHKLVRQIPQTIFSVSATTRARRPGEREGRDYYFLTKDDFRRRIRTGEFLEWAKVYSQLYGTPKKPINKNLAKGLNVLLDIDMQGALSVKRKFPSAFLVFMLPPSLEHLRQRLIKRGKDSREVINKRMKQIEREMKYIPEYDFLVINDNLDRAVKAIKEKIKRRVASDRTNA